MAATKLRPGHVGLYPLATHPCSTPRRRHVTSYISGRFKLLYAVCVATGYLMSFWNRPFFPEWCADATLDNSGTYDTMVRIAGSYDGFAQAFKAVADHHGWTHIVLLSDDETTQICWYGAEAFEEVFGNGEKYSFTWLRIGSNPTDKDLDDILLQIRSRTRGLYLTCYYSSVHP